jgi:hypothetical protein
VGQAYFAFSDICFAISRILCGAAMRENAANRKRRFVMIKPVRIFLACAALTLITPLAIAETPTTSVPVATIVTIKTPPGITRERLEAGFKQAVPLYQGIPGLTAKYFIANDDSFGGMYLWKDRASAEAWYNDAWRAKAKATYGVEPTLVYFDSPLQIDNNKQP